MMSLNSNVIVNVLAEAPPVTAAGFSSPAILANPGAASFAERLRFYTTAGAVEVDRLAGDIDDDLAAILTGALSQTPHTPRVGAIRGDNTSPAAAMQITYSLVGTGDAVLGDTFTIGINGIEFTHTAAGVETPTVVATALRAGLTTALAAEPVTVSGATNQVIITADTTSDFFSYYASDVSATMGFDDVVIDEAGIDVSGSLAAALVESTEWYGLTLQSYADVHLDAAATWTEANRRLFIGQSDDPAALTGGGIGATLAAQNLKRTNIHYHPVQDEHSAFNWLATTLAADPDVQTTIWAYKTLEGVTPTAITETQKLALEGINVSVYSLFFGEGATWEGKVADGSYLDELITTDWVTARSEEAFASLLLRISNLNQKIPYTDAGIEQCAAVVRGVLQRGVAAGHFVDGSTTVNKPLAADVPTVDKAARLVRLEFVAQLAGAIQRGVITGYLVLSLPA